MNTGAVMGKKATLNAFVGLCQGNVRQVEPDDEVVAQGPAPSDHRTRVSPLFQEFPELHREMSAGLDLRRNICPPGLEQMPEEPERKPPAPPTGLPAAPMSARAVAFMAHEVVKKADVEGVETRPVERQPDRDVPGRTVQYAGHPGREAKAFQVFRIGPDNTGIPFRNHIGQWRAELFRRHDLSPVSVVLRVERGQGLLTYCAEKSVDLSLPAAWYGRAWSNAMPRRAQIIASCRERKLLPLST